MAGILANTYGTITHFPTQSAVPAGFEGPAWFEDTGQMASYKNGADFIPSDIALCIGGTFELSQTFRNGNYVDYTSVSGIPVVMPENNKIVVGRQSFPVGTFANSALVRFSGIFQFTGAVVNKEVYVEIVPKGGLPGSGGVIYYKGLGSTELSTAITGLVSVDSRLTATYRGVDNASTGTNYGPATGNATSTTVSTGRDVDIIIYMLVMNGNTGKFYGGLIEVFPVVDTNTNKIVCWGDSLTQGTGSTLGNAYPIALSRYTARATLNQGVGGNTSAQVLSRYQASIGAVRNNTHLFFAGANDVGVNSPDVVIANLLAMVDGLGHDRYLVANIFPSKLWTAGSPLETAMLAINAAIDATFPGRTVDTWAALTAGAYGVIANDRYTDNIHLTDLGYVLLAREFAARLQVLGI